ncbi:MAG: T9SS type A sorting domain-containing protein [Melioribacteraceae bacterium]|nr:T9SS type A sorting domain-containing protein [Melioribacteraceae bacterium]MCF8356388.1 T9SS type A sorting domain-containing protein [Melioribacteraceae bacterium]MCF8395771.1 T9SS type A sorting domain-containing protein [Melioribacteraceae bacterium]MCF8420886.1 T9SS type A sorting domain-containing protein [Melioribacteraceae bacterium]
MDTFKSKIYVLFQLTVFLIFIIFLLVPTSIKASISKNDAEQLVLNHILEDDIGDIIVYVKDDLLVKQDSLDIGYKRIPVPYNTNWVFFVDEIPFANWEHECSYIFVDEQTGNYQIVDETMRPMDLNVYEIISYVDIPYAYINGSISENLNAVIDTAEPNNNLYAVIIQGDDTGTSAQRFWNDVSAMYSTLVYVYGYPKENIFVHFADGSSQFYGDLDGDNIEDDIDYPAYKDSIEKTFRNLSGEETNDPSVPELGPEDQLFIYLVDHGSKDVMPIDDTTHEFLRLAHDPPLGKKLYDRELAEYVNDIRCSEIIFLLMQCYSGGFVKELSYTDTAQTKQRTIHTAANFNEYSWPEVWETADIVGGMVITYFDEYVYYWTAAARGYFPGSKYQPWRLGLPVGDGVQFHDEIHPDLNSDGRVTMEEAFYYADYQDTYSEFGVFDIHPVAIVDGATNETPQGFHDIGFNEDLLTLNGISGNIDTSQSVNGSFLLNGNLTINSGVSLQAMPGTKFFFSDDNRINVYGTLNVDGLSGNKVLFDRKNPSVTWQGIRFYSGSSGSLEFSEIRNVETYGGAAISIIYASPSIKNCTIENLTNSSGIYIYGSPSASYIYNNTIRNGNYHGIYINRGNAYIRENHIYGFTSTNKAGVYCYNYSTPLFAAPSGGYEEGNNVIENNYHGIFAGYHTLLNAGSNDIAYYNHYVDNSVHNAHAQSYSTIYAQRNYWSPTPPSKVYSDATSTIYDFPYYPEPPNMPNKVTNNDFNDRLIQARAFLFGGEYNNAFGIYRNLISEFSNLDIVLNVFSDLYYLSERTNEIALPNYLNGITHNPNLNEHVKNKAYELLSLIYENTGNYEQFEQISDMLIQNNSDTEMEKFTRLNMFYHYYAEEDYPTASVYLSDFPSEFLDEDYEMATWLLNSSGYNSNNSNTPLIAAKETNSEVETITTYKLSQNYPNPFNPITVINYQLPENGFVTLKIYDVLGREVTTLVNREMSAGKYRVELDASKLSTGVYFYQLKTGNFLEIKKMLLLR